MDALFQCLLGLGRSNDGWESVILACAHFDVSSSQPHAISVCAASSVSSAALALCDVCSCTASRVDSISGTM